MTDSESWHPLGAESVNRWDKTQQKAEPEIAGNYKDFLLPFLLSLKIKEARLGSITGSKFHLKKRNFLLLDQSKGKGPCIRKYWWFQGNFVVVPEDRFLRERTDTTQPHFTLILVLSVISTSVSLCFLCVMQVKQFCYAAHFFCMHYLTGITSKWFLT